MAAATKGYGKNNKFLLSCEKLLGNRNSGKQTLSLNNKETKIRGSKQQLIMFRHGRVGDFSHQTCHGKSNLAVLSSQPVNNLNQCA